MFASPEIDRLKVTNRSQETTIHEPQCPLCTGMGFFVLDVPVGHPDFGHAFPCKCTLQRRAEHRLSELQSIGQNEFLRRLTFDSFIVDPPDLSPDKVHSLKEAFEACIKFAEAPSGWLVLTGTYGCGKTHLAAAIVNERLRRNEPAVFMTVPDLLDHLRSSFGPQSEVGYSELFEQLRSAPLLILDDLGAQSSTPWAQEKLYQLLNYRYNFQIPTVITTNQRLEDLDPRVCSRLKDIGLVGRRHITATDYRSNANHAEEGLSTLRFHVDKRFENFVTNLSDLTESERANLRQAVGTCKEFAHEHRGWLVLVGKSGCGKTHLAAAIANQFGEESRLEVMFVVVPDLLDHLRATFGPQSSVPYDQRFDEIRQAPLLILDDLGTESATPWAREKLFQLLNHRYNTLLPTVITTSIDPDKLEPWLRTRIKDVDRCKYMAIVAPGFRGSKSQQALRHSQVGKLSGRKHPE